jgi:hypothetical protein
MIGGDILLSEYLADQKWRSPDDQMFPVRSGGSIVSFITTVMLLSKGQIGTDPFLGAAAFHAGVGGTLFIALALMLITQLSMYVFSRCWQYGEAYSYREVWAITIGKSTQWIPTVLLIVPYCSFNFVGLWEIYFYPQVFLPKLWSTVPDILLNQWFLELLVTIAIVLPCCYVRRLADLWPVAYLSFFAVAAGMICLLLHLVRSIENYSFDPEHQFSWFSSDPLDLLDCASNYTGAFFLHPFLALILRDLHCPTVSRCMNVAWVANFICLLANYGAGLLGYLLFTDAEAYENIFNYLDYHHPEILIGTIAAYVITVCTTCFFSSYLTTVILELIVEHGEESHVARLMAALTQATCCMMATFAGDKLYEVMYLLEDFCCVMLLFVIPGVFYLLQFRFVKKQGALVAIFLIIAGLPWAFGLVYSNVISLIESWPDL